MKVDYDIHDVISVQRHCRFHVLRLCFCMVLLHFCIDLCMCVCVCLLPIGVIMNE